MESMFIKELKKKGKKKFEELNGTGVGNSPQARNSYDAYMRLVNAGNLLLSFMAMVAGVMGFILMGYLSQIWLNNGVFYFSSYTEAVIAGLVVGTVLWVVRSFAGWAAWSLGSQKEYEDGSLMPFFILEGMSEMSYVLAFPFFLIMGTITSTYFATLVIGGAVAFKYALMWNSYRLFLSNCSRMDKLMLVTASIFSAFATATVLRLFELI